MIDPTKWAFELLKTTIVDVIDPKTRRLVASTPFPKFASRWIDESRILVPTDSASGIPRAEVWRVTLSRPAR